MDLLEISGGTYEQLSLIGVEPTDVRESTRKREAYFIEYAERIKKSAQIPVMITGGIKRLTVVNDVLDSNIDLVGIASALAFNPALVNQWEVNQDILGYIPATSWKDKTLSGLANMALVKRQLRRLGKGDSPSVNSSKIKFLIWVILSLRMVSNLTRRNYLALRIGLYQRVFSM